ncbi:arginine deiminase [Streptoalloteichus tenebrarius]|uniref:Arginine deiminase n=1 Tax=Streptoalloteichus tenebrarius (strain ATCC 17920 / DSM 40477 / JCM 4838 / CBS 697.72 / NBRC 16177 / NCIMB 11028 / NRRL B-12390 / A12253. 1 / ISP 5477) TaxID=1933 RepID=A0ABT1HYA7_STRSD|nr:arginine deiminase [Streptoalloteichus tenebrarius]MCP2260517.1 arginine deiminase [Streptoalloteichus tenebrarius]BFF01857.1 arginine deiminase [Streptoalloteichus tenebrarius]
MTARQAAPESPSARPAGTPRVDSEVGPLRTVLLHRPGAELKRLTPRNNDQLLFDGIPWVDRAQEEHDAFADTLRARGVEVLLLADLLAEALTDRRARAAGVWSAVDERRLGIDLADTLRSHLTGLDAAALAHVLTAGMTFEELPAAEGASLVRRMHHPHDFAIDPLPNLLFTRDSSLWVGDRVAVASLSMPARRRETSLTDLIYAYHPRFARTDRAYGAHSAPVEGGDVLLLAPGVLAIGVGERTTPAGAESFARSAFADGLAHTVLAVPIAQERATMHLDTVCTMVDRDALVMYPVIRDALSAYPIRPDGDGGVRVDGPVPFLEAAAEAMGIERLRVIDTGLDPVTAEREQWDDGNNTLAIAPGVVLAYERNVETNARLEDAGVEVLRISGSELGSGRGGPRCMSCPIERAPLA